jgi:SAM-dependent methyltransferase
MMSSTRDIKAAVQEHYGAVARGEQPGCGCVTPSELATTIGYSPEDVAFAGAGNLGVGCGNPIALAELKPGMTVLDLGSGAGFDAFLAWRQVGPAGRVIGVDMTDEMLELARHNAAELGAANVEFRKGHIEQLPVDDSSVDFVISNCVINLSPDKPAVFREIYRVLKPGGSFAVSDIVVLTSLPDEVRKDVSAYVGCIAGASLMGDYVRYPLEAGLANLSIPQIMHGSKLTAVLAPGQPSACCGSQVAEVAANAVASIKLHGRKPSE